MVLVWMKIISNVSRKLAKSPTWLGVWKAKLHVITPNSQHTYIHRGNYKFFAFSRLQNSIDNFTEN